MARTLIVRDVPNYVTPAMVINNARIQQRNIREYGFVESNQQIDLVLEFETSEVCLCFTMMMYHSLNVGCA